MNGPDEKTAAQIGTDAHKTAEEMSDVEYIARRARDLGMDEEAEVFERLLGGRDQGVVVVADPSHRSMGLGAAMALAAGLGGPSRDRTGDRFFPLPRNIPRGAVKIAPGVWARDPANQPKKKFKGSKAAKKASRQRR